MLIWRRCLRWAFQGQVFDFGGIFDGQGSVSANLELSQNRADAVLAALKALVPGMPLDQLPTVEFPARPCRWRVMRWRRGAILNRRVELAATGFRNGQCYKYPCALKESSGFSDDQVIMQNDPKHLRGFLHLDRHGDVSLGRRGGRRRGGCGPDDGGGVEFKCPLDDLSGRLAHGQRCPGLFLIGDQHVLAVQKQDAELFGFAVGHDGLAIIQKRVP